MQRHFGNSSSILTLVIAALTLPAQVAISVEPIDIGTRLELLLDQGLVESMEGAAPRIHRPAADKVAIICDKPWEGNTSAYFTVFHDGSKFRAYYRGSHWDTTAKKATHREVTCYAESSDGIQWTKPSLGLYEFDGSKDNNIVWDGIGTHCFTPFHDTRPGCPADEKYKAISRGRPQAKKGLYAFKSADGIHWKLMQDEPVITAGAFDSQNLAFWDAGIGKYREYHRSFINGVRSIVTGTSDDFIHWTTPTPLVYSGAPNEHLYTNAILPHPRAQHILLGFPTRYHPKRGSQVEPLLMASRDGLNFFRYVDELIPVTAPQDRMGNRSNYMAWGLVPIPGDDLHEAVYATEAYYEGPDNRLRRFRFRKDRYASIHAAKQGEFVTKPLKLGGDGLVVNHLTEGDLKIEVQQPDGDVLPGFSAADCKVLRGDGAASVVSWGSGKKSLRGQTVRLRFIMNQSDVFAFQSK